MDIDARHKDGLNHKGTKKAPSRQVFNALILHKKSISWAAIIFILSSFPGKQLDKIPLIPIPYFDKWVHLGIYLIFSVLILLEWKNTLTRRKILTAVILGIFYGAAMELMQAYFFSGRTAEMGDMVSNVLGSILAWPAYKIYCGFKKPSP